MNALELAFRAELKALLAKYDAELAAANHWQGYAECGEDVRMTVTIPGKWDKDGETLREFTEIDLKAFQDGVVSGLGLRGLT